MIAARDVEEMKIENCKDQLQHRARLNPPTKQNLPSTSKSASSSIS
jgi:hypothetical protein